MKTYCGIGSRDTPEDICKKMTNFAKVAHNLNWILRSGGANGADTAFEIGALSEKEIYLPWGKFNNNPSKLIRSSDDAMKMAAKFHPAWNQCSHTAKLLHARNSHQVMGRFLDDPVKFLICWTKEGKMIGGTSQALRIAQHYNIPIFNMGDPEMDQNALVKILKGE